METVQFIHITDTHLNAPGQEAAFLKVNVADKLMQVFRHIKESQLKPAFILVTGDLAHEGNAQDYAYIRTVMDEGADIVGAPVYVTLGNHDHRSAFREGYLGELPTEQAYYYSETINGLRLIALNSQMPGQHHGTVDDEQLAWLALQLQTPAPNGTIVALHHPLLDINGMSSDHMLSNAKELGDMVRTGDVTGIFAGHVHSNNVGMYNGILSVAASGTAFAGERLSDGQFRMYDFCSYNVVTSGPLNSSVQTIVIPTSNEEFARFYMALLSAHKA
ncbi:metallophosphoesterase family protein [Paenibacillus ginsengarvi]|uniref:Phosphodiesterase n=1 Tax=Paenibacillus ginsengarvi TaxID=400777 RepID=A0A3B0AYR5_9BACL|nr:metallophosphoesterase [Paenibacillus ginsengarvi]RKN65468.1 phosphodiesterase [Paenibacillus ginsengarvi]